MVLSLVGSPVFGFSSVSVFVSVCCRVLSCVVHQRFVCIVHCLSLSLRRSLGSIWFGLGGYKRESFMEYC